MSTKSALTRGGACLLALAAIILLCRGLAPRPDSVTFMVFNTVCRVTVYGDARLEAVGPVVVQRLTALHHLINAYDPESELSRLNAAAHAAPFACSDGLWDILLAAREAYRETEGAFDPTVGPLMRLWGFHGKRNTIPTEAEIEEALAKVGLDKVVFDDEARSVRFAVEGISLDFGGIAKGYACDLVSGILRANGVDCYMIDLGGNIQVSEKPPRGRRHFKVGIRDPVDKGRVLKVMALKGCSVATSGNYERSRVIEGRRVGHIMDPASGRPGEYHASVTAITPRGVDSDVYSTAVFVRGAPLARRLAAQKPGTSFFIVDEDKATTIP